jgi:branched-chain amino acid transport system permease protein
MSYYTDLATLIGIQIIAVVGVFAISGLTGLMSMGQGGFMAIGAYTAVLTHMRLGVPWLLAVALGVVAVCAVSPIVGYPSLRLRRDFFAIATFGFGEAVTALGRMFTQLTGGTMGMSGIPRFTNLGIVLVAVGLSIFMAANLKNSRLGRNSLAIRSDELSAEAAGIDVFGHKMRVFVFGASLAGLAGGLQAFFIHYMDPMIFNVWTSVEQVVLVYFGGINSLTGCVVSTLLLSALPEAFRFARLWRVVIYSVFVVAILNMRPQGLLGDHELTWSAVRTFFSRLAGATQRRSEGVGE